MNAINQITRAWLTEAYRIELARQFDCDPSEVEKRLEARERQNRWLAERREYTDPCGHERSRY